MRSGVQIPVLHTRSVTLFCYFKKKLCCLKSPKINEKICRWMAHLNLGLQVGSDKSIELLWP